MGNGNGGFLAVLLLLAVVAIFALGKTDNIQVIGAATDADADGLSDNFETYISGTSPTNWDTDGDNYFDSREVAWGRNPLSNLSAINCCSDAGNKNTITDNDVDGISDNYEQAILATSTTTWDTDSDGYCDSHEILDGYDPKSSGSSPGDGHTGSGNCDWFR